MSGTALLSLSQLVEADRSLWEMWLGRRIRFNRPPARRFLDFRGGAAGGGFEPSESTVDCCEGEGVGSELLQLMDSVVDWSELTTDNGPGASSSEFATTWSNGNIAGWLKG